MSRYRNKRTLVNSSEYYKFLRKKRNNAKLIRHFATPIIKHPSVSMRASIVTSPHMWRYGDRFYKLANDFYNDPNYWWVIAWYNGLPTEADINFGDVIEIPVKIEDALRVLGI
tara:strand:+ start:1490 stop:1828 length:339 start_codon:yes stop_codon:yes gene_type:complete